VDCSGYICATFKVVGLVTADQSINGLIEGQEVMDLFHPDTKVLQIHDNSVLAQSIDCLKDIVSKRRKIFETLYGIPSERAHLPLKDVTPVHFPPVALPGSSAPDSLIDIPMCSDNEP
jgi:hypothetical protein